MNHNPYIQLLAIGRQDTHIGPPPPFKVLNINVVNELIQLIDEIDEIKTTNTRIPNDLINISSHLKPLIEVIPKLEWNNHYRVYYDLFTIIIQYYYTNAIKSVVREFMINKVRDGKGHTCAIITDILNSRNLEEVCKNYPLYK